MSITLEQLVEKAFIRAFPGQDEDAKKIYLYEFESWGQEAFLRMSRTVALGPQYKLLQRRAVLDLGLQSRLIHYCTMPAGVDVDGDRVTGNNNDYAISAQRLALSTGLVRSQYVEWRMLAVDKNCVFGVRRAGSDAPRDVTTWDVYMRLEPPVLRWYSGLTVIGTWGAPVINGYARLEWDENGDAKYRVFDAQHLELAIGMLDPGGVIGDSVVPGVLFLEDGGALSQGRIGQVGAIVEDGAYRAQMPDCPLFIQDSIAQRGSVRFVNSQVGLDYVESSKMRDLPYLCNQWQWTFEGDELTLWRNQGAGLLPSEQISVVGNIILQMPDEPSDPVDDLPVELQEAAVLAFIEIGRERVADIRGADLSKDERRARRISGDAQKEPSPQGGA